MSLQLSVSGLVPSLTGDVLTGGHATGNGAECRQEQHRLEEHGDCRGVRGLILHKLFQN